MLSDDLAALGLQPGDVVMVHASMRAVGGRAEAVVQALLDVLGPEGTLLVYVDFEPTAELPDFDLARSPAMADHGVFAEVVRRWPGAIRSANPGASMVAVGGRAAWFCADHPLQYGYGPGTPLARLVEAQGKVLLLGSHLEHVTLLHHAEHLARLPNKRVVRARYTLGGEPVEIEEFDTSEGVVEAMPEGYFGDVMRAFIAAGQVQAGPVGGATALWMSAEALVRFAVERMERELG
ncbi:MAG: aminoglycoside 3-N-acetyltransferase [Pseudomonadota bacterium]